MQTKQYLRGEYVGRYSGPPAWYTPHHTPNTISLSQSIQPWPPLPTVDADSHYLRFHKPYSPTHFLDARQNNMLQGNVAITTHSVIFTQLWTSEFQGRSRYINDTIIFSQQYLNLRVVRSLYYLQQSAKIAVEGRILTKLWCREVWSWKQLSTCFLYYLILRR